MERDVGFAELLDAAGLSAGESLHTGADLSSIRINSLTCDSREVCVGGCFVAIPGGDRDGHAFVSEAVRGGASVVVTERSADVPRGVGNVRVRDTRTALARLAAAFHGLGPGQVYAGMKLVGVTGTNGKTTTCHLLRSILSAAGCPTALLGTIGYDLVGETRPAPWTTPPPTELYECLARAGGYGATHAVMEVSSHALAQSRCDGHAFEVGVFTNLSGDHLDYHASVEAYADAKKRLFDQLDGGATAVVNMDDEWSARMVRDVSGAVVRFGLGARADVSAVIEETSCLGTRFVLRAPEGEVGVSLPLVGRHNVANALAAAGAAMGLGIDLSAIVRGLEGVGPIAGRLQRVDGGGFGFSVFVDYAHTDDALANVLSALRPVTSGRLICVFGCGGDRDRSKRARMGGVVGRRAEVAVVTSDNPRSEDPKAIIADVLLGFGARSGARVIVEADRGRAIARAVSEARAGDTVLIAGKGHEDYQIVGAERRHFDDVEVVRECLDGLESM